MSRSVDHCPERDLPDSLRQTILLSQDLLRGVVHGLCRANPRLDQSHPAELRRIGELQHLLWAKLETTSWTWQILTDPMLHPPGKAREFKSIQPLFNAISARSGLLAHTIYARIYGRILMRDPSCARYAAKHLPDNMTASVMRVYIAGKRNLYAEANSTPRLASIGDADDDLLELTLWVVIFGQKRAEFVSSHCWRKKRPNVKTEL